MAICSIGPFGNISAMITLTANKLVDVGSCDHVCDCVFSTLVYFTSLIAAVDNDYCWVIGRYYVRL